MPLSWFMKDPVRFYKALLLGALDDLGALGAFDDLGALEDLSAFGAFVAFGTLEYLSAFGAFGV